MPITILRTWNQSSRPPRLEQQVAARPLHETVDCGAVHVFQHAVVVVLQRQVVLDVDQEAIRDSWVGHVVAQAARMLPSSSPGC